jgi:hypothetical protein
MEQSNSGNAQPVGPSTNFSFVANPGSANYYVTATTEKWNSITSTWDPMFTGSQPQAIGGTGIGLTGLVIDDPAYAPGASAFADRNRTPEGSIYRITFTVYNDCASASVSHVIKINRTNLKNLVEESTDEVNLNQAVSIYPNPMIDEVNFTINAKANDVVNISILDVQGRKVMDVKTNAIAVDGDNMFKADISDLKPGLYFYNVKVNNQFLTGKIIKQ